MGERHRGRAVAHVLRVPGTCAGRRLLVGLVAGSLLVVFAAASSAAAAVVELTGGRLTVDARDVPLPDLLGLVARRASFRLTFARAPIETVTAAFSDVPLDEAVRRLLRGHSFVLVYEADQRLSEVRLVGPDGAATLSVADRRHAGPGESAERAAEIAAPTPVPAAAPVHPTPTVRELARTVAEDEDAAVRARATAALAALGGADAISALRTALEDAAAIVRVHAVHALSRAERAAAIPVLSAVLAGDRDPQVRLAAARALGSVPTADARLALEGATRDANPAVRDEARRALARLDGAPR